MLRRTRRRGRLPRFLSFGNDEATVERTVWLSFLCLRPQSRATTLAKSRGAALRLVVSWIMVVGFIYQIFWLFGIYHGLVRIWTWILKNRRTEIGDRRSAILSCTVKLLAFGRGLTFVPAKQTSLTLRELRQGAAKDAELLEGFGSSAQVEVEKQFLNLGMVGTISND